MVTRLHQFEFFLVIGSIELGIFDHLLNFGLAQAGVGFDGDLVFLARALVFGAHMQDAVGIDVKRDFNLRRAAGRRRNALEVELAQHLVAGGDLSLALKHLDRDRRLTVFCGGKGLRELGWNGGVFGDHLGHHATHGFNAQAQRRDIEQQHIFAVAGQHLALNGCAHGHRLIRIDVFARLFAKQLLDLFLHLGHAGHATDQNHIIDVCDVHAGVFDRSAAGGDGALDQLFNQGLELGAAELDAQVLGAGCICGDVGQIDVGLRAAGEFDFGFFCGFFQALQGQYVFAEVNALVFFELGNDEFNHPLVEVLATQKGVTVGGQHLKLFFTIDICDFNDGDIKGAAAEVINRYFSVAFFVFIQAKGQCSGGWLIDDALDFEPGNSASVLGGLALRIVEISWHRDDCLGDFFAEVVFSGFLHLAQHIRADLLGREPIAA